MSVHANAEPTITTAAPAPEIDGLLQRFDAVRRWSLHIADPLGPEDCCAQSMPSASPIKWHLAHTTWFFETFILQPYDENYTPFDDQFSYLFNSYYNAVGAQHPRPERGLLTRPPLEHVRRYRAYVQDHLAALLTRCSPSQLSEIEPLVEIGMHHEQQHQELMLADLKHLLSCNPLDPAYRADVGGVGAARPTGMGWVRFDEGVRWIGHAGDGFAYDNESPRHRVFVQSFELADRLVTNREYQAFMADGGYEQSELWLDEGWSTVQAEGWRAPLYWRFGADGSGRTGGWSQFTLGGVRPIDPHEPVCHVSFFEADAFARWAGARLATEAEWETACTGTRIEGNFVEADRLHPAGAAQPGDDGQQIIRQAYGDLWEWTRSQYDPYPGYRPPDGALGEYNGKFMCNQFVLRGGSCATPRSHIRPTYRNFFPPAARWQFTGIRLTRDA